MLDSATDIDIKDGTFLNVGRDYVHTERNRFVTNISLHRCDDHDRLSVIHPEGDSRYYRIFALEDLYTCPDSDAVEEDRFHQEFRMFLSLFEDMLCGVKRDPPSHRRMNWPWKEIRPVVRQAGKEPAALQPSRVLYSTDPTHESHASYAPVPAENTDGGQDAPFPLNSYTSPDFEAYKNLYQGPSYRDWPDDTNKEFYLEDFDEPHFVQPPVPPPHTEYWQAYNAWQAWYTHCVASWQASLAAWTTAMMSWTPPWLGMCAPSWFGTWAPLW